MSGVYPVAIASMAVGATVALIYRVFWRSLESIVDPTLTITDGNVASESGQRPDLRVLENHKYGF